MADIRISTEHHGPESNRRYDEPTYRHHWTHRAAPGVHPIESEQTSDNKSRVAVVTGGGSGSALPSREQLSTAGHRVAVLDLNTANAEAVAASIRDAGGEAIGLTVDVADRTSVDKAVGQVREKFGPIEILVTSAGVDAQTPTQTSPATNGTG